MQSAHELGFNVIGLSFHVGSQVPNIKRHVEAVKACLNIIDKAKSLGIFLEILDIGGGFPVDYNNAKEIDIVSFCAPLRDALSMVPKELKIIAEPGHFLSTPCMFSIASVVGRATRFDKSWYYLDDGVYCSYSGQIFDHVVYPKFVLKNGPKLPSVLAGPTCDSIDIIVEDKELPDLAIGDLVIGKMMGAYTIATATDFNFLPRARIITIDLANDNAEDATVVAA